MSPRRVLPTAVLPLDSFGEQTAHGLEVALAKAEPQLLETGWLRILENWSAGTGGGTTDALSRLVTHPNRASDPYYQTAAPRAPTALVILLGSLSQSGELLLSRWREVKEDLSDHGLLEQVRALPVVDISRFNGRSRDSPKSLVVELTDFLSGIAWRGFVYLTENRNPYGLVCSDPAEVQEAVSLFLQAIMLGHHWETFSDCWLNREPPAGRFAYASFSVLAFQSLQAEVHAYMAHVGLYELINWAKDKQSRAEARPQVSLGSIAEASREEPRPPVFRIPRLPGPPHSKEQFRQAVENSHDAWFAHFVGWYEDMRHELYGVRNDLASAACDRLQSFDRSIADRALESWRTDRFLGALATLADGLSAVRAPPATETRFRPRLRISTPEEAKRDLAEIYGSVAKLTNAIPNPPSLIAHLIAVLLVQALITYRLLSYWPGRPELGQALFWALLVTWLLGLTYLAWRVPAWRLAHALRNTVARAHRGLVDHTTNRHKSLRGLLSRHWNGRAVASSQSSAALLATRIRLCCRYLEDVARREQERFPYRAQMAKRLQGPGVFSIRLESDGKLDEMAEELHKDPRDLWEALAELRPALTSATLAGDASTVEALIRDALWALYGPEPYTADTDATERLQLTMLQKSHVLESPLVGEWPPESVNPVYHCVRNETWQASLEEALGDNVRGAKLDGMDARDRVYFYSVYFGAPPEALDDDDRDSTGG
jgi:hypothetical protein